MPLAQNLQWGKRAVSFVKSKVGYGMSSNNIKAHVIQSLGGIEGMMKQNIYNGVMKINSPIDKKKLEMDALADKILQTHGSSLGYQGDSAETLDWRARSLAAIQSGVGNCGEQSAIAYFWLKSQGVRPIDFCYFRNQARGYDHAWVLIGRPKNVNNTLHLLSMADWGETDVVWCDPWQGGNGMVYSINDFIKKKVVNLDSVFKLDTVENVVMGLPKSLIHDE